MIDLRSSGLALACVLVYPALAFGQEDAPDAAAPDAASAKSSQNPDRSATPATAEEEPVKVPRATTKAAAPGALPSPVAKPTFEGAGIEAGMPDIGGEVNEGSEERLPNVELPDNGNRLVTHGYVRAPLRVGYGPRNDGGAGHELHSPARTADLSYTDWVYTNALPGPWTELFLNYGSGRASVTASIASYNQTVAGYRDLEAQLGINQAFVTLTFPDAFGSLGGLRGVFGSFTNRYGSAGKTGGGMYDTYLFGRTRVAGETLTANFDLSPSVVLVLEQGFGGKLDAIPFTTVNPRPDYLPYPGPVPEGSTFVHHEHAVLEIARTLSFGGHYLHVWTPDDHNLAGTKSQPGYFDIYGGELRLNADVAGDGYLGYSHIHASHILPIADAIEVLHSVGGYSFKNNFFGGFDPATGTKLPDDSGTVDSLLFQYALSLGKIARFPRHFAGNGPDLSVTPFAMWNKVKSQNNDYSRLKWGVDTIYSALDVLAFGLRYDLVQPNLADGRESFSMLSPKVILRTRFVAQESVTFQYSRYFLGSKVTPGFPYDGLAKPDPNAFMINAAMWW
ncbi:MAG TPA: hypothetical protein VHV51_13210 [Polyangiaceae bacterium]|jgi:hypothetical protein|nr:hypothetical protein [Polyangiaceae bacterium]